MLLVALTFFLKNAFSIQHWEQLHSFPSLQLNLFPFWRNSHFHIDKIILFWFGAQSAQLQTSFEMGREKSSNLDFEQNFGSNSNLTSWLPDWKFWKRAKYQWFLRKRQMESIFPPIPPPLVSTPFLKCTSQAGLIIQSYPGKERREWQVCSISKLLLALSSGKVDTAGWIFKVVQTEVGN